MPRKKITKTNPLLIEIAEKLSGRRKAGLWRKVRERILKPRRRRAEVNLWKLNKLTRPKETVVVPGVVLGHGTLDHPITVAALKFTRKAREKIMKSGGEALEILELYDRNPKGSNVKIIV